MKKGWTITKLIAIGSLAALQIILMLFGALLNTITATPIGGLVNGFIIPLTFILCRLIVKKVGAAIIMGILVGILAIPLPLYLMIPGFLPKVLLPIAIGLMLEVLYASGKLNKKFLIIISGGLIQLTNLWVGIGLAILFVMPSLSQYLKLALSVPAFFGALIQGLIGGFLAWLVYQRIKNTTIVKRIQQ